MLKDWLRLLYCNALTLTQKRALVTRFRLPRAVFQAGHYRLAETEIIPPPAACALLDYACREVVEQDCERLRRIGGGFMGFNHPGGSFMLSQIPDPPLGLFHLGNPELLRRPAIAIVGSRNPGPGGRRTTAGLAAGLCEAGLAVVSGLAAGIDSFAHRGALDAGGDTLAVLGTGIDRCYPESNRRLYEEIARKSLVLSEFPPGTPPRKEHFPRRNRIISGLSQGVLVVEAGLRSGSLITARLAAEQGREVFAVPGSIYQQSSRGCHQLIRQGAKLTETVNDVLEELAIYPAPDDGAFTRAQGGPEREDEKSLYNLIDYAPTPVDGIIEASGLTAHEVSSILVELELQGLIEQTAGGYQRLP